jgi:hypothetical protein
MIDARTALTAPSASPPAPRREGGRPGAGRSLEVDPDAAKPDDSAGFEPRSPS